MLTPVTLLRLSNDALMTDEDRSDIQSERQLNQYSK